MENILKKSKPHVYVIGPGAVGTFVAALMGEQNYPTSMIAKGGQLVEVARPVEIDGRVLKAAPIIKEAAPNQVSFFFFAVKAGDLHQSFLENKARYRDNSIAIILCNGAIDDVLEKISISFPGKPIRIGSVFLGVKEAKNRNFVVTGSKGKVFWGPLTSLVMSDEEAEFFGAQRNSFFEWHPEALQLSRKKWLFNTCLNSICAVKMLETNGKALAFKQDLSRAFDEAVSFGKAYWGGWAESNDDLFLELIKLVDETYWNENSMVGDLRRGRKTESDFLAGFAARNGNYPFLAELHQQICSMTRVQRATN